MRLEWRQVDLKISHCNSISPDTSIVASRDRMHEETSASTSGKPYACHICDFRTTHKNTLTRHLRVHSGEKPYACNKCDFRATQKGHLTRHMRTHSGERPFPCDRCPFRASQKSHLVRHYRSHTGEKPFACDKCDFRTNNQSNLIRHKKRHVDEAAEALLLLQGEEEDAEVSQRAEAPRGAPPSPASAAAPPEDVHRSSGASSADEAEGLRR